MDFYTGYMGGVIIWLVSKPQTKGIVDLVTIYVYSWLQTNMITTLINYCYLFAFFAQ